MAMKQVSTIGYYGRSYSPVFFKQKLDPKSKGLDYGSRILKYPRHDVLASKVVDLMIQAPWMSLFFVTDGAEYPPSTLGAIERKCRQGEGRTKAGRKEKEKLTKENHLRGKRKGGGAGFLGSPLEFHKQDGVAHTGSRSSDHQLSVLQNLTDLLRHTFSSQFVFPVLGHEDPNPALGQSYREVADLWRHWLPTEALHTFNKGGYYTIEQKIRKLRLVAINTNLYTGLGGDEEDPKDQWAWLETVLDTSRRNKETVYLVGHIPPGVDERQSGAFLSHQAAFLERFNTRYLLLVRKYSDVIVGQFFGHLHSDSFRVVYKNNGRPVSWMFISPAVSPRRTPSGANNPGLRLYKFDTDTGQLPGIQWRCITNVFSGIIPPGKGIILMQIFTPTATDYFGIQANRAGSLRLDGLGNGTTSHKTHSPAAHRRGRSTSYYFWPSVSNLTSKTTVIRSRLSIIAYAYLHFPGAFLTSCAWGTQKRGGGGSEVRIRWDSSGLHKKRKQQ
uniref:(California timema) hypothetical protein n=1 Tax=Timema californicum TaxID=61474 RepID=A0A7R9J0E6_TIMCA|nr:unnamed protein product [Timema californicum]